MKIEIKVPAMGESISEATIGPIIKPNGSQVLLDEELLELETEKVNQVLYAPQNGVITWNVAQGNVVTIGQVIGTLDTDQATAKVSTAKTKEPKKSTEALVAKEDTAQKVPPKSEKDEKAPPAAQTGGARATKEAFISDLAAPPKPVAVQAKPKPLVERETRKPLSKIRKIIASRLVDALQNTAMLTTFNEVDMTKIMALRDTYKDEFNKVHQTRLGFMSFFVKASVSALKAFPEVNSYIDGQDLVTRNYFDISIAVGTDRGLVVPVIRQCDNLSFDEIERSLEDYGKKAREGGLTVDDLQGGCFTITNGGVYGSLLSTPILNMPQSAILGMHKIEKRPVVVNDEIVIRPMMYLALSYDHRVIDGKEAVQFLVHIKNCLEDPSRLLLDL